MLTLRLIKKHSDSYLLKSARAGIICNLDYTQEFHYNVVNFPKESTLADVIDTMDKIKHGPLKETCMGIIPTALGWGVRITKGAGPETIWN